MSDPKQWKNLNQPYTSPDPNGWTSYQRKIYASARKPLFSTKPSEWEALAKRKPPTPNFGYVSTTSSWPIRDSDFQMSRSIESTLVMWSPRTRSDHSLCESIAN